MDQTLERFDTHIVAQPMGESEAEILPYREAVRRAPFDAEAWNSLGHAYFRLNRMDEAIACYRRVSQLLPDFVAARTNCGTAHVRKLELREARSCYEEALYHQPADACTHWNSSLLSLLEGKFEEGFLEYEWRFLQFPSWQRGFKQPKWDGFDIAGKTILLHAEQGFGDTIQFSRFIPLIAATGARVIFECHRELVGLLGQVPGISQIVAHGDPLPHFNVCCSLMSLPRVFRITADSIPVADTLLKASPQLEANWKERLRGCGELLRVGVVWAGSKEQTNPTVRSDNAQRFARLARVVGVRLISLQKPASGTRDVTAEAIPMLDVGRELNDWTDTAAIIANLDFVIGVDTAVIHLAAAMGKPTWTLLRYSPDWRWLLGREDSPWYPAMRLFRQPAMGDWDSVFERVTKELGELTQSVRN